MKAKAEAADQEAHRVAERMTKAEADREEARKEASSAREDAARLSGQVEAMQTQASDLMRALAARQPAEGAAEQVNGTTKTTKAKKAD